MDSKGEDYEIPKTVVIRLSKAALPENVQIAKDAKLALTKSARLFVQFLTACSNEVCDTQPKGGGKVTPEHVLKALEEMEFDFGPKLQEFLEVYRAEQNLKTKKKEGTESKESKSKEITEHKGQEEGQQDQMEMDESNDGETKA